MGPRPQSPSVSDSTQYLVLNDVQCAMSEMMEMMV